MREESHKGTQPSRGENSTSDQKILRAAAIFSVVGMLFALLLAMLWLASSVLLLLFAALLVAILLTVASRGLARWLPISRQVALALVVLLTLAVVGIGGWLLAPRVSEQAQQLFNELPRALQVLRSHLQRYGLLQGVMESLPTPESLATHAGAFVSRAGVFFTGVLGAIANVVIILVVGIYWAAQPRVYVDGLVRLFPQTKRARVREVFDEIGGTLGQWLLGKLVSMLIIGALTAVGLALLQVPLALLLGIVAGLLDFIPYLGPIIAGVPAVLIALAESPSLALYVILLFVGLQAAEGYLLLPLIERRTVALPPALTISAQLLLGTFFGLAGVALATPIVAVFAVLVAMLYVEDVLGDQVRLPAER